MEMASFAWIFVLVCVQFCRGEDVLGENDIGTFRDSIEAGDAIEEKKSEEWTEEDEKWLEEIQSLLTGDSEEDYDMDYEEFGKLLSDIEELMKEHHPEKSNYEWLVEIEKWFGEEEEEDYEYDSEELTLSWLSKDKQKTGRRTLKRFSSV